MEKISLDYYEKIDNRWVKRELFFSSDLIQRPYSLASLFVVRIEGQSMEPFIQHNSLVVSDLSLKEYENGSIFLVYKDDRMWIKKASVIENREYFVSLNKGYEHLIYPSSEVRIVAKAVLTFTAL